MKKLRYINVKVCRHKRKTLRQKLRDRRKEHLYKMQLGGNINRKKGDRKLGLGFVHTLKTFCSAEN